MIISYSLRLGRKNTLPSTSTIHWKTERESTPKKLMYSTSKSGTTFQVVETLDEFQSTTYRHGSTTSLFYETYYDLLINACVRYDKTKRANIGKRRNVYNTNIDDTYVDHPTAYIDHVPDSPYGGIDLSPDAFCQVHRTNLL